MKTRINNIKIKKKRMFHWKVLAFLYNYRKFESVSIINYEDMGLRII